MTWNIIYSNPKTAVGDLCSEESCPISIVPTLNQGWYTMKLANETCTLCGEETGRRIGSGDNERSVYPVLSSPIGWLKKGDICGPVCKLCYEAMGQLEMIDNAS